MSGVWSWAIAIALIAVATALWLAKRAIGRALEENKHGLAHCKQEQWAAALECFSRAAQLDPASAVYRFNQGFARFQQKEYSAALADYTAAAQLDPSDAQAHNRCGVCHTFMDNFALAIPCLERALALAPNEQLYKTNLAAAHHSLGDIHFKHKNYEAALAAYNNAVELLPNNATYQKAAVEARRKAEKHRAKAQDSGKSGDGAAMAMTALKIGLSVATLGGYTPS